MSDSRSVQVYIGNLSRHISDRQFSDLAMPFGAPDSLSVPRDSTGRGMGYGVLEYADAEHARAAIAGLHGKDIDGQILNAMAAKPPSVARRV